MREQGPGTANREDGASGTWPGFCRPEKKKPNRHGRKNRHFRPTHRRRTPQTSRIGVRNPRNARISARRRSARTRGGSLFPLRARRQEGVSCPAHPRPGPRTGRRRAEPHRPRLGRGDVTTEKIAIFVCTGRRKVRADTYGSDHRISHRLGLLGPFSLGAHRRERPAVQLRGCDGRPGAHGTRSRGMCRRGIAGQHARRHDLLLATGSARSAKPSGSPGWGSRRASWPGRGNSSPDAGR